MIGSRPNSRRGALNSPRLQAVTGPVVAKGPASTGHGDDGGHLARMAVRACKSRLKMCVRGRAAVIVLISCPTIFSPELASGVQR
jgi:hypothetical protein